MSERARARLVSEFSAWAKKHRAAVEIEPDVVETLLAFKESYLGSADPAVWRPGQITELLTEIIPRKVSAGQDWSDSVLETVPVFADFLTEEKRILGAQRLRSEAEQALPAFHAAMDDPSRWGTGKRLLAGMGVDSIDGPEALENLITQFNGLPDEERDRIFGDVPMPRPEPSDPPVPLPTVRLASNPELVEAARESALIADIVALARWLGPRREITGTGALRVKDGKRAAVDLGLVQPDEMAERELLFEIRSSMELAGLDELWRCSVGSGFVELSATRAYPGQALTDWRDGGEAALGAWRRVFDVMLASLADGDLARLPHETDVHASALPVLFTAYVEGEVSRKLVVESLVEELGDHPIFRLPSLDAATKLGSALDDGLDRLVRLGAVTRDGDAIRLTPLGVWRLNELYSSFGWDAPAVGDLRDADAPTRLEALTKLNVDEAEVELAAWLEDAEPAALADELVMAFTEVEPAARGVVFDLLNRIGAPAKVAVDRLLDTPMWRYASAWHDLRGEPCPRPMSRPDQAWLMIEQMATMVDLATDDDMMRSMLAGPDDDFSGAYDDMWRSGHPRAGDVLEALARVAPNKGSAKSARKAAFKARNRS